MMKVGDIVMFTDKGRYKKWFYGKIGTITSAVGGGVSVQWMYPVAYLDMRRVKTSVLILGFTYTMSVCYSKPIGWR
jgi:hypothetical protein